MAWVTPITDRTQRDVEQGTAKGYCNSLDLNRLEGNCQVLAQLLGVSVTARQWGGADFPTQSELLRIVGNIAALRAAFRTYEHTPPNPEHPLNSWQKWNAAEQILADIYDLYHKTLASLLRCGEGYAGDQIGVM